MRDTGDSGGSGRASGTAQAAVIIGAVVTSDDNVAVSAEALDVVGDTPPGDIAAVLDAELAVDVHAPVPVGPEQGQQGRGETGVMPGVVVAPGNQARRADTGVVSLGEDASAEKAGALRCVMLDHAASLRRSWREG